MVTVAAAAVDMGTEHLPPARAVDSGSFALSQGWKREGARALVERARIGELLRDSGVIRGAHVIWGLAAQRKSGEPLGEILLALGLIREEHLLSALSRQLGVPIVSIGDRVVPAAVLRLVPEHLVRRHRVFPLMAAETISCRLVLLATSSPSDHLLLDEVAFAAGTPVVPVLAARGDIAQAISRHFGEVAAAS